MNPADVAALRGAFIAFGHANPTLDITPLTSAVDQLGAPTTAAPGPAPSVGPAPDPAPRVDVQTRVLGQ